MGEGTGAVAAIPLWDMALAVYDGCYSFEEGGIEAYTPQEGEGWYLRIKIMVCSWFLVL